MAVSYVEADEIKSNPPPPTEAVLKRMLDYCDATGMEYQDLAHEIGYSPVALRHFRNGTYRRLASTDVYLRHALSKYFDEHPSEGADPDVLEKLLMTRDTKMILARAREAQRTGGIIVIEGPPGTGKTVVLKTYTAKCHSPAVIYFYCHVGITAVEMLRKLCRLTGARANASRARLLYNCVRRLKALAPAVVLFDQCHELLGSDDQALKQLQDVQELSRCGCLLAGHFSFLGALTNGRGRMLEQWISRIDLHEHLHGLDESQLPEVTEDYLGEKLPAAVLAQITRIARVRDRNFFWRNKLARMEFAKAKYLSMRRVNKFLVRLVKLREIPENAGRTYAELAPAVAELLMQPEAEAL
jgi:DNA transposition AAA+ family ATPase